MRKQNKQQTKNLWIPQLDFGFRLILSLPLVLPAHQNHFIYLTWNCLKFKCVDEIEQQVDGVLTPGIVSTGSTSFCEGLVSSVLDPAEKLTAVHAAETARDDKKKWTWTEKLKVTQTLNDDDTLLWLLRLRYMCRSREVLLIHFNTTT